MVAREDALVMEVAPDVPDDEALSRRSDAYLPRALGLACYIMGDAHDAEDATQEAMARAWKARRSLRQLESFEAWIDRIVANTCREKLRRRRGVREIVLPDDGRGDHELEARDGFAALLARDAVGRALLTLNADQRTVVVLRYWRDLSLDQIADRLGWPLGTVKSRLHYALAALKDRLELDELEVQR